jgi:hypothetical protein
MENNRVVEPSVSALDVGTLTDALCIIFAEVYTEHDSERYGNAGLPASAVIEYMVDVLKRDKNTIKPCQIRKLMKFSQRAVTIWNVEKIVKIVGSCSAGHVQCIVYAVTEWNKKMDLKLDSAMVLIEYENLVSLYDDQEW